MKVSEVKKGMKVYPVIKTPDGPLSNSKEWKAAREANKNYLTVIAVVEKSGMKPVFLCSNTASAKTGDTFYAWDLRAGMAPAVKRVTAPSQGKKPVVKKPTKKPVKKPVKKSIKKTVEKPAKKTAVKKPKATSKPTGKVHTSKDAVSSTTPIWEDDTADLETIWEDDAADLEDDDDDLDTDGDDDPDIGEG